MFQSRLTTLHMLNSHTWLVVAVLDRMVQMQSIAIQNVVHTKENIQEQAHEKMLIIINHQFSSVQISRSVVSDSLRPHESQHARPPCPSPTPGVH